MYFSDLGLIALVLACGFAIYTIVVAVLGARRDVPVLVTSAKRGVLAVAGLLLLASAVLIVSLYVNIESSPFDRGPEQVNPCPRDLLNMPGKVYRLHTA